MGYPGDTLPLPCRTPRQVEETSLRTNDMLNAVRYVVAASSAADGVEAQQQQQQLAAERAASPGAHPLGDMLAGDAYYASKQQLIIDEQLLLRLLRFDVDTAQPHKWLYVFAVVLEASQDAVRLAVCLLNDGMVNTRLCTQHPPDVLAAAALQAAALLLQQQDGAWSCPPCDLVGVDPRAASMAAHQLIQLLLCCQQP